MDFLHWVAVFVGMAVVCGILYFTFTRCLMKQPNKSNDVPDQRSNRSTRAAAELSPRPLNMAA